MKSAITVSLVAQAKGGPFVFWNGLADACGKAAALGFDAIEIFPPSAGSVDIAELQGLLDHHGLKVAAIGTGAGWVVHQLSLTSPDAKVRHDAREFIAAIIELAGGFGAPAILGSMQGRVESGVAREQAVAWLGEALDSLGELAAAHGVPFLYEPLNRYETNLFNRQQDAADWLSTLKTQNVRLLCDLFHMAIEEADPAVTLRACGPLVGHVHFADSNRRAIGMGHTAIAPIVAALRDIGYKGYLSAEIVPLPDSDAAAKQTIESFRELLGRV